MTFDQDLRELAAAAALLRLKELPTLPDLPSARGLLASPELTAHRHALTAKYRDVTIIV